MENLEYKAEEISKVTDLLINRVTESSLSTEASVLALTGDLGAGKTTLVQNIASYLGVNEVVTSPTFVIMKRYQTKHPKYEMLVHIDAYRIEKEDEMLVLGFLELLKDPKTLVCIEWPEKIPGLIPSTALSATLVVLDDITRKISYG